jgi:hypothetical protein
VVKNEKTFKDMMSTGHIETYVEKVNNEGEKHDGYPVLDFDFYTTCTGLDMVEWLNRVQTSGLEGADEFVERVVVGLIEDTIAGAMNQHVRACLTAASMQPAETWNLVPEAAKAVVVTFLLQEILSHGDSKDMVNCMVDKLRAAKAEGPKGPSANTHYIHSRRPDGVH